MRLRTRAACRIVVAMKQTPVAVGIPLDTIRRVESVRDAMAESTGLDVSRNKVFNMCIEAGLPLVRAKLGLPVAPAREPDAATSAAVRPDPAPTTAQTKTDRDAYNAARRKRIADERAAAGCTCPGARHRRECKLSGKTSAPEGEAAS